MNATQTAVFAAGCFWCTEAIFQQLRGVSHVESGYTGGHTKNPNYDSLHYEDTGHAEAIQITFDPSVISYQQLLEVFYYTHNPTTPNRQGNDVGAEYRSIIFYANKEQQRLAQEATRNFAPQFWDGEIVTEIKPLGTFWTAEEHHQNFYRSNPAQPYCQAIINPKLQKFRAKFEALLA